MDHYEMEYRGYFLEVRLQQRIGAKTLTGYNAEVRVAAGPAGAPSCAWTSISAPDAEEFGSREEALREGMARGVSYIDALLAE